MTTSNSVPTQTAITGHEDVSDLSRPEAALAQFYRAFNHRDLSLMEMNWDHSPMVAMDNPVGGIRRGWPEIRAVYERIFNSGADVSVEFHDYTIHEFDNVFYAVGRERGYSAKNGKTISLAIRTTRIFHRDSDGRWRQIHHHGSIDDPQMLSRYQESVR